MITTLSAAADFQAYRREYHARIEQHLQQLLEGGRQAPERLIQAMRYAVLNGGKRIRPLLAICACETLGGKPETAMTAGCAVELLHCYSLVHDDLPAMDDDDLRRGQPTCHIAFDEATAILAGDALQTRAFEVLATAPHYSADQRIGMLQELARASGSEGMVGGQMIDLEAVGEASTLNELQTMHRMKTGALIEASVIMGAMAADSLDTNREKLLRGFSQALGLAFQIRDDIIDKESDTQTLGKTAGKDEAGDKPTYTTVLGLDGARDQLDRIVREAHLALEQLGGQSSPLSGLVTFIAERNH